MISAGTTDRRGAHSTPVGTPAPLQTETETAVLLDPIGWLLWY